MAGDWIKMRIALSDDPAVIAMAESLSIDEFSVVGRLHHLWSWADTQSRDGHASGVTQRWIDRYVRCEGFSQAMVIVGWLSVKEDGIEFPNFDRHNGDTGKSRALATNRKQRQRSSVTDESREDRDENGTREEKRREEESKPKSKAIVRGTRLPSDWIASSEQIDFCRSERPDLNADKTAEQFRDYWHAKAGNATKIDWNLTWKNWVRNQRAAAPQRAENWYEKNDRVMAELTGRNSNERDNGFFIDV